MKNLQRKAGLAAGLVTILLYACGHLPPPSKSDPSHKVLNALSERNAELKRFKGIGRFGFRKDGRRWASRAVFAGEEPERLRVDLLVVGRPAIRFADDGLILYLLLRAPEGGVRLHRAPSSGGNLERVLGFPLRSSDLFALLAGRVPVRPFRAVRTIVAGQSGSRALELEDDQGRVVERIHLTTNGRDASQADFFSPAGALEFRIEWNEHQEFDGFRVPARLQISDGRQTALEIQVQSFRAQGPLSPGLFRLTPPAATDGS